MKITLLQTNIIWEEIDQNLQHCNNIIDQAQPTDLMILPEMFATGFTLKPHLYAQKKDGSIIKFLQEKATQKNTAITTSLAYYEDGLYYNRGVFVFPNGDFLTFDKRHLFSPIGEDKHYTPGNKRLIIQYKGFQILPLICYDLRFPVWSRSRGDYDLLIYMANWPAQRNHTWQTLLYARSYENQAYVAGVNRVGKDINDVNHVGNSMLIKPDGTAVIDNLYTEEARTITASADITIEELNKYRKHFFTGKEADYFVINT